MNKRFTTKIIILVFLLLCLTTFTTFAAEKKSEEIDIQDYVESMQPGWNLGNTYDAVGDDETAWGNPVVEQELIQKIAADGFKSIRIPITFDERMQDSGDYQINSDFLSRVDQTVQWALDEDLKVMINVHHDSWLWMEEGMNQNHDQTVERYNAMWTQLADFFKDYPNDLMFESINEPRFSGTLEESQDYLDELNTNFYDIVRHSGGNNDVRPLVIPTLDTGAEPEKLNPIYDYIQTLNDPHIIATVHYYGFWPFSVNIAGHTRFDQETKDEIHTVFDRVHDTFTANGIPVVIGEYGLLGFDTDIGVIQQGEKLKFFEYMLHYAQEKELTHMLWDNGQHLDRSTFEWQDQDFFDMLQTSWEIRSATPDNNFIYLKNDEDIQNQSIKFELRGHNFAQVSLNGEAIQEGKDYQIDGSTITFTSELLNRLSSEEVGQGGTLNVSFTGGMDWDIDVHVYDTPQVQPTEGSTSDFHIPTHFNGDQLATMEAYYEDGDIAGPQDWTGYKEFGYTFSPDYEAEMIELKENFFNEVDENRQIDLTFHFWSGESVEYSIVKDGNNVYSASVTEEKTEIIDIQQYTRDMQPGWNLGNTYDAVGEDETAWGNPVVEQELIQKIAADGFKSIRIPVTFDERMQDSGDYQIDSDFLSRVDQTVQWALEEDLKVMINVHHDSWIWMEEGMKEDHDQTVERYNAIWTQLANYFKDYSNDLMFESINEPRFSGMLEESQDYLDELNTNFYDIVRHSGGNNDVRPLVMPTLDTGSEPEKITPLYQFINELDDSNIIATVHYYGFWPFSVNIAGHTRFDQETKNDIHTVFDRVHDQFTANGIPVVIGEYGLLGFDVDVGGIQQGEKLKFFEHMLYYAQEKDFVHMIWDNGQHLNRETLEWNDQEFFNMLQTSWNTRSATPNDNFLFLKKGEVIQDQTIEFELRSHAFDNIQLDGNQLENGTDYLINGQTVTFTSELLNSLSIEETGHAGTFTVTFTGGVNWDIDVNVYETPVFEEAEGTSESFKIPTVFNGDQLATLEAYYSDGSIAGPQNWTAFKEFGYTFSPNYEEGYIELNANFFNDVEEDRQIDLTFHFWSGETVAYSIIKNGDAVYTISEETTDDGSEEEEIESIAEDRDTDSTDKKLTKISTSSEENLLPDTATNQYQFMASGALLLAVGAISLLLYRKKRKA